MIPNLDERCGDHFRFRDLVECGETWRRTRVDNTPRELATYAAIERLVREVLDPLREALGPFELSYGFAGWALTRHIGGRIAPSLDQHAGHERGPRGRLICPRLGQAVDLRVEERSSLEVARWIIARGRFDRLYYYGPDRPLHVSLSEAPSRSIVELSRGPSGRLVPRRRSEL